MAGAKIPFVVMARIYAAPTELGWVLGLCFYKHAAPLELFYKHSATPLRRNLFGIYHDENVQTAGRVKLGDTAEYTSALRLRPPFRIRLP